MFSLLIEYPIFILTTNLFSIYSQFINSTFSHVSFMEIEELPFEEHTDDAEQQFYGFIRRHLLCLLFFSFLYCISYGIIRYMKTRSDNDELYAGDEDYCVYRISTWICANSLSISIGSVTLLPFSVLGAEVLQLYPDNFYLKWLNFSLINTLWAYSQGFSLTLRLQTLSGSIGHPILARFYETLVVCSLVLVILVGIADCVHAHLFSRPSRIWFV
ncbi:hypothetical protein Mgra_00006556 [Meloidogyne graminicola]|uniref:Uncharacterized protein n=1 Tax=Meloidogyne graminicola TaxID=189291 RepID=A0A8S9ZLB5_9BILA|nr:hypothetical protein Mgra_00006556 [Meloidogyne graminicola]